MQSIIAATDFSKSSINACNYAAMLASTYKCRLVLFNLVEVSWFHSNSGVFIVEIAQERRKNERKAKKQIKELKAKFPALEITTFIKEGNFKKELKNFITHHDVKLVVMGLAEKNRFYKSIYGTHGVDTAGKINAPVIIVPEQYKSHNLSHAVLAVDNSEKLHKTSLKPFETLLKYFDPKVNVIHFRTEEELFEPVKKNIKLNDVNFKIEEIPTKSLYKGIKKYNIDNKTDLITIISKKHSLFYELFAEANTHKIAMTTNIPVMAIHE